MSDTAAARNALEDIKVTISGERHEITGWTGAQIVRGLDTAADAFFFSFPWEPTEENKRRFRAYRTSLIEIWYGDDRVISGIAEIYNPEWSAGTKDQTIEGRSTSGVLLDISAGPPFEIGPVTFNELARQLSPVFCRADPDISGLTVDIEPGQTIYDVLSSIAAAHGLWALPQDDGTLLFSKVQATQAVADLREGVAPLIRVSPRMNLLERFYEYLIVQTTDGNTVSAKAIDKGVDPTLRARKIIQPQQESNAQEAANFARAKGIIGSYSLVAEVVGWTVNGLLWDAGMTVSLYAPTAMVYRPYEFVVKQATLQLDAQRGAITQLELSFPQVFAGGQPEFPYPWSIEDDE